MYDLLGSNGSGRVSLWYGENNLSSTNTDVRNSGVEGGLYYVLSALHHGEAGMAGESHWWDLGPEYGFVNWDGSLLPNAYAIMLLERAGFQGSVTYRDVAPDNWARANSTSPLRVLALSANTVDSVLIINQSETQTATASLSIRVPAPGLKSSVQMYQYNQSRTSTSLQALPAPPTLVSGHVISFSTALPPLTMQVFQLAP